MAAYVGWVTRRHSSDAGVGPVAPPPSYYDPKESTVRNKPFICSRCGDAFSTAEKLRKHAGKCFRYGVALALTATRRR